ncbi:MAG: uracil-DNA glycosylase [Burkholderiaceae bacterium]|nr:uracil-DNA glycosylase [Burkholderiaceae bacterium]
MAESPPMAQPPPMAEPVVPVLESGHARAEAPEGTPVAAMTWGQLRAAVQDCTRCGLCRGRTRTVFGSGAQDSPWMIVGEAPGAEEDARGEPFVGQAGRLLESMLGALGLSRERDVFIANVLKCRPPGNRNPEPDEIRQCEPYLHRQIALLKPRGVLVMGRFAAQALLQTDATIASLRGRVHAYRANGEDLPLVVTYHPAYLLRNLPDKAKAWADLCLARERFGPGAPRGAESGLRAV